MVLEHASVAEAELLIKALRAEPVSRRHHAERRVEASHVEAAVAPVAQQHRLIALAYAAHLSRHTAMLSPTLPVPSENIC